METLGLSVVSGSPALRSSGLATHVWVLPKASLLENCRPKEGDGSRGIIRFILTLPGLTTLEGLVPVKT